MDIAPVPRGTMKDMQAQPDKLRAGATACSVIAKPAKDQARRELSVRLAKHDNLLAGEKQKAMTDGATS